MSSNDNTKNSGDHTNSFTGLPSDMIESIRGKSVTLSSNANRLDKLEFHVRIIGGIAISVGLGIAIKLLTGS